jgi:DNA-binding NarL/FixJ family response regulator
VIRVIVADDHELVRRGLKGYLETNPDISVLAQCRSGRQAADLIAAEHPDVAVLDINMPDLDGISATREVARTSPDTGVIILSAYDERHYVVEAVRAGARGYVLKTRDATVLMDAVKMVAQGHMVLDPDLAPFVTEELNAPRARTGPGQLTSREMDILRLVADGSTNPQIAERLFVSVDTVKTHLEHVYQKLGTGDRTAAVAEAFRRGLID